MKTIRITADEERVMRNALKLAKAFDDDGHLTSLQEKLERAPDDTVYFTDIRKEKSSKS
jgi:hypothetical protein